MILKVRARGHALVTDYKFLFNGVRRFVGWRFDPSLGELVDIPDLSMANAAPKKVRPGGFVKLDEVVEVDAPDEEIGLEYARAIATGDLWPGDDATAEYARKRTGVAVKFDPTFGGDAAG